MHGENATSQDAEQLVGDPPAKVVVAPEAVRSRLVAADDDPLERNRSKRKDDPRNKASSDDGRQQGSDAFPVAAANESCEE